LKQDFIESWKPTSANVAPLRVGVKPFGLICSDRTTSKHPILPTDYQAFQLLFIQTTRGLNQSAGILYLRASSKRGDASA
jgi:hypothetical protein